MTLVFTYIFVTTPYTVPFFRLRPKIIIFAANRGFRTVVLSQRPIFSGLLERERFQGL